MRQTRLWFLMLLVPLALAGCTTKANAPVSSSKPSISKSSSKSQSTSAKSSSQSSTSKPAEQKPSSAASSAQPAASSQSSTGVTAQPKPQSTDRLGVLRTAARQMLPGIPFPTAYTPANGQALNVAATGSVANGTLYFSEGAPQPFNQPGLPTQTAPLAILTTITASDAQIEYLPPQPGLPTVALGDGLTGTQEGAAGSRYITWQEGRWAITVQASAVMGEDPLPLAKQAVALFATQALPAPDTNGEVRLHVGTSNARNNTITWRSGDSVYQVSGVDAMATIRFGVTLR